MISSIKVRQQMPPPFLKPFLNINVLFEIKNVRDRVSGCAVNSTCQIIALSHTGYTGYYVSDA